MPDMTTQRTEGAHRLFTVCGGTDIGSQRTDNQDTFVIADLSSGTVSRPCIRTDVSVHRPGMLVIVCDGMGGPPAGDVAARVAVSTIKDELTIAGSGVFKTPGRALASAVAGANRAILATVDAHPEDAGMGTTCTAAVFGPEHLSLAQVGDSRAYLLRGGKLQLLTRDQTVAADLVDKGLLAPEQVEHFPYRHILTQALGTQKRVRPVMTDIALEEGDRVLLCSDGLHGPVSDEMIATILNVSEDPSFAAHALVSAALAAGGPDNVTAVVTDCGRLETAAPRGQA
jgi:serine/threonine protein phosphatase PrpC